MNPSPGKFGLSRWQMAVLVFCITLCVTPFAYDSTLLRHLHRMAWVPLVAAYGVGLAGVAVALALMARFPGVSIVDYAPGVLGPVMGRIFLALLGLLLLAGAPVNLHVFALLVHYTQGSALNSRPRSGAPMGIYPQQQSRIKLGSLES